MKKNIIIMLLYAAMYCGSYAHAKDALILSASIDTLAQALYILTPGYLNQFDFKNAKMGTPSKVIEIKNPNNYSLGHSPINRLLESKKSYDFSSILMYVDTSYTITVRYFPFPIIDRVTRGNYVTFSSLRGVESFTIFKKTDHSNEWFKSLVSEVLGILFLAFVIYFLIFYCILWFGRHKKCTKYLFTCSYKRLHYDAIGMLTAFPFIFYLLEVTFKLSKCQFFTATLITIAISLSTRLLIIVNCKSRQTK